MKTVDKINDEIKLGDNETIDVLGVNVDCLSAIDTIELVEQYVKTKTPLHLMGVNADKLNDAMKNKTLKKIINSCGIVNADGVSVVYASKYLKKPLPERVAGIDLMMDLVELASKKGYSIYLIGAKEYIVEQTKYKLLSTYKSLKILGCRDGYFGDNEWDSIANELTLAKPDFVFVGITSPKKEYFIEHLQNLGVNSVFMGVGGSFDVISGNISRAPKWMQDSGLEWLHRVIKEPKRLFKRYFIGNIEFLINVFKFKHRIL